MKHYIKIGFIMTLLIGCFSLISSNTVKASGSQGTLYGNAEGTRFCCAEGSNGCGAAPCRSSQTIK